MSENIETYNNLISGLAISYTWRGHGSAIFIEIGELTRDEKRNNPIGEYSVMLDCDWRVEESKNIQCSSLSDIDLIEKSISGLIGESILKLELVGALPEIKLILSSGKRIQSFTSDAGNPDWAIFLPDKSWLGSKEGNLVHEKA